MPVYRLNDDPDMLQVMAQDLIDKITEAFDETDSKANVLGVFDLHNMREINETDRSGDVSIGVGYLEGENAYGRRPGPNSNVSGTTQARMFEFRFVAILQMCDDQNCNYTPVAQRLLSLMRLKIAGTRVEGDGYGRAWSFVAERPEIADSKKDSLYYSQVWQLSLPNLGNQSS